MSETYYHGTPADITDLGESGEICLAFRREVAEDYAAGWAGAKVYEFAAEGEFTICDDADVVHEVAGQFDWYESWYRTWELLDEPSVREALAERGYDAAIHEDEAPNNAYEHATLRVFDPAGTLEIVGTADA